MTGRTGSNGCTRLIAVDFGIDSTVIAVQDGTETAFPALPGSRVLPGETVPVVPSVVHCSAGGEVLVGDEVGAAGLTGHPATVTRPLHYIAAGSPARFPAGRAGSAGYPEAGAAFLRRLLDAACGDPRDRAALVFVVPPAAGPAYRDWIRSIRAAAADSSPSRVIDALSATVLGYGLADRPGSLYLILDAADSPLTATAVLIGGQDLSDGSRQVRVLGEASGEAGSARADAWIVEDVVIRSRLRPNDPRVKRAHDRLLREAARVRGILAGSDTTVFSFTDPAAGLAVSAPVTRADLTKLLASRGMYDAVRETAGRALAAARGRGAGDGGPAAVLLTGSGWAIPGLAGAVREQFGDGLVHADHPLDARARGALAAIPSGPPDRIRGTYAVRYWDAATREHRYRFLVRAGARYPSAGQVGRMVISAACDGQTHLGIPLYRFGGPDEDVSPGIELVSEAGGGMRIAGPAPGGNDGEKPVWVNEREPVLLAARPPAVKGEPRFELTFFIDGGRQLLLTARDVQTGELIKKDTPVYRLD